MFKVQTVAAKALLIAASIALFASCANGSTSDDSLARPNLSDWKSIDIASFSLQAEPSLPTKSFPDRIEIGKNFVVTAKEARIDGLKKGDFDAAAPILESVVGKFKQIFDTQTISIGGNKAMLVTSTKVNANFYGIFVPLDGKLIMVYTSTLALDKDSETARSVVQSLMIKPE